MTIIQIITSIGINPQINPNYPFPSRVTFDNGNSRIIHNETDCKLLEELVYS